MTWVEVFNLFLVCHLTGDFILQTEFQAVNKHGGLASDWKRAHALVVHILTYCLPFIPACAYVATQEGSLAWLVLALVAITHLIQDDGRLLKRYVLRVKKTSPPPGSPLWIAVDQSFHIVVLFGLALIATAA